MSWRSLLLWGGRILTVLGGIMVLFLAYEFLLTGLTPVRSQSELLTQFKKAVPTTTAGLPTAAVPAGTAVSLLSIPRIGVEQVVVEGTRPQDLKQGPGHLHASPLGGELGNVVIAARRTTYGAPFRRLGELSRGDSIRVTTGQGSFTYRVEETRTVGAGEHDPVSPSTDSKLTLVTSDPPFIASGRLAVIASLDGPPIAVPGRPRVPLEPRDLALGGDWTGLLLLPLWSALLVGVLWLSRRVGRRWPASIRGMLVTPVVLTLAVLAFSSLDTVLPATL